MVTTMAVITAPVARPMLAISKVGRMRKFFLLTDKAVLLRTRFHPLTNVRKPNVRVQCGVAASKTSSGNKHQVANAGGNITQINYYGSDYSQAHAAAQNNMDPEKFTKPLADMAAGVALKSPSVEEMGYSDRIMQITSGNSTITTQEAVNAVVAYGVWPGDEYEVGEAIDKPTIPGPACDRFYTLDSLSWTNTWKGNGYELPGCLTDLGIFGQNCYYHFLMRSGFCVHVQCNASKFHQGMLLVVAIPECQSSSGERSAQDYQLTDQDFRDYPVAQLTLFPHQMINLRTNNSATLILPYMNASPSENALSHNYWSIWVLPIVPLSYSSGATTVVPITISIAPMNSMFSGLRNSVPIPRHQGVPTFDVPGSGQFMTTIRNAGFPTLPDFEETPAHHIPGEVNNLLEVMQIDTFCKPSDDANYLTIDVSAPTDLGSRIASWDMSLNANLLSTTYLARATRWFSNYHGSLNLTLMFCGSAMATGKLLIAYTPPGGAAPTTRRDAMLATHTVWDIGLQSSINFVIPWVSQTVYRFGHTEGNVLSYRGYITVFYQTHIVVPPGAQNTCQIVVLASAAQDFVCRLPTDSAYYQGIEDEIGKVINGAITTSLQTLDIKPIQGTSVGDKLSVTSGDSAALTAPETGASATTEAASVMETRSVNATVSGRETTISNFLSKYAMFNQGRMTASSSSSFKVIPLYFSDSANTQKAVRAKYRMFTYMRMGFDVVIVITFGPGSLDTHNKAQSIPALTVQAMYCPPGCPTPTTSHSPEWFLPTTPSVFQRTSEPNICIRIPFVGLASAYTSFYNGYANFNPAAANYGKFPGNFIGNIALRIFSSGIENAVTSDVKVDYVMYARPTGVRAWGPRPIVTLKEASAIGMSRGRIEFVNTDSDYYLMQEEDGTEVRVHRGPKRKVKKTRAQKKREPKATYSQEVPDYAKDLLEQMCVAHNPEDETSFHILPVAPRICVFPNHLYMPFLLFSHSMYHAPQFIRHRVLWTSEDADLICVELERDFFDVFPKICTSTTHHGAWCMIKTDLYQQARFMGELESVSHIEVIRADDPTMTETRIQHYVLEAFGNGVEYGFCGCPVICPHGICGITTAGSISDQGIQVADFIHLAMVPEFQAQTQGPAEEQGLKDWCADIAKEAGTQFGLGTSEGIASQLEEFLLDHQLAHINWKTEVAKKIIANLIKLICGMTLIAKSEDKMSTAAAVGVMLGIDILLADPFDWLKSKIYAALGRGAHAQGPSDWIKEFNAACTAAKGLEWVWQKVSQFIDWVKALFKKEEPRRKKFMQQLEDLPLLMEHIDKIAASRGQYSDEVVKKVCNSMRALKRGADIYGVERNAATTQIVKYYQKAMTLLQSMSKGRVEPVAMLVHGSPGTGKSLATEIVGRVLTQKLGGHRPYSLPPDPKHFDGYAQQPVVIMDDLGQNPDGEDCKLLCQMVSSTEFVVPMAALEEKGMAFTSQFVLASTNLGQIRPPTVSEPKAIQRRFFIDVNIEVQKDYEKDGKLAADSALSSCSHPAVNFHRCCPMICGKAVLFKCNKSGIRFTLDDIVSKLLRERKARNDCGSKLDALFQGNDDDDWFETDYDRAPNVLKTIDEQIAEGIQNPPPREIADLLKAVNTPEVLSYCESKGWIIPAKVQYQRTRNDVKHWINWITTGLTVLSCVASLGGFFYLMYTIFASSQGAYSGQPTTTLKKPELRRVAKVQGPDMEFANKLMNQSLFNVQTQKGIFTGLGIHGKWLLLPKHAQPDDKITLDGKEFDVEDCVVIENGSGSLELVAVKINRPVDFRDIRKFVPDHFTQERECMLVVDNELFPRMFCPVGTVSMFGFLNLSNSATYNTCQYRYPTRSGQCGGVVCKSGKILAMHIGGDGANGYGAILTKKVLAVATEQGQIIELKKTTKKPINLNSKTKLHPSVFHDIFPGTKEPAALHPKDKRLEVDLDEALLGKYKGNVQMDINEHMMTAMHHYLSQIKPLLPDNVTEPLSLEEVVYGTENLEGLDLATSAGYPYVSLGIKKRDLIPPRGQSLSKLTDALDLYGYDLPFVTYIKDELRPAEKIKVGKSRLIECSSMNDTIRMKRTFGRLFQVFHQNPGIATGSAVGCNPDVDWSRFFAEMGGQPLVAFDYSNYDASMNPKWFELLKLFLLEIGYTQEDVKLIDHINYSTHLYKDKEYRVDGGMPSGCSGTSIFNSINNNHILRTLVLDVYKGIHLDDLRIIAYGDDVIMTYPFQLDAGLLAEAGKSYGLTMTPPDKGMDFNETTWDNVTFLKRTFKPDEDYPFLIHPVYPMKEVYESIRWCRSAASTQEHVRSLCQLAWHNGQEEYEGFLAKIRSVPVGRALLLPSYQVLRQEWLDQF
uniref:Genome polyprotein n=1 Tax=Bat picornavirus TaxID=1281456 RepID=A0A0D3MCG9_9PICO|nr:polyprotein [Bat picornavirus]